MVRQRAVALDPQLLNRMLKHYQMPWYGSLMYGSESDIKLCDSELLEFGGLCFLCHRSPFHCATVHISFRMECVFTCLFSVNLGLLVMHIHIVLPNAHFEY